MFTVYVSVAVALCLRVSTVVAVLTVSQPFRCRRASRVPDGLQCDKLSCVHSAVCILLGFLCGPSQACWASLWVQLLLYLES